MGKPKAPTPPDPMDTAAAQTGTNIGTSIANNTMGMVNQVTPYGSLTYNQTGKQNYTDPYTGQSYDLPTYEAITSLSPEQQAILDQNNQTQLNLATVGNEQSGLLGDYLGTGSDDIDAKLYDIGAQRLDPRFAQEEDALRARLSNQGIVEGSEAYNREMQRFSQGKNDAYNQLILGGRSQAMSELNNPINQITALLSGSQVANPGVSPVQPSAIPTTDVAGLINNNYQQRLGAYNTQTQQQNGLLGGLFGLGAAMI